MAQAYHDRILGCVAYDGLYELAQLWAAQYYAIYCESYFEALASLKESAVVILEIKTALNQTQDFARRF